MYSNDSAVLSASTVAAPAVLGVAVWPNLTFIFIGSAFALLGVLYLLFKRRSPRN
jgi:hypothetical protein